MKKLKEKLGAKLKKKNGFTLIEMLVVVAIIVILVLVSIPMVTTSIDKAKQATDDANIRAAKAEAVIEYVGNEKDLTTPHYYDAENGKIVDSETAITKAYSQKTDGQIIQVQVTAPATGSTDGPTIDCKWVKKN